MSDWTGEGFPPAGTECEVQWDNEWVKCKVIGNGITDGQVNCIFQMNHDWEWLANQHDFRPIKSDRDKAIEDISLVISKVTFGTYIDCATKLYDAGYRKTNLGE